MVINIKVSISKQQPKSITFWNAQTLPGYPCVNLLNEIFAPKQEDSAILDKKNPRDNAFTAYACQE